MSNENDMTGFLFSSNTIYLEDADDLVVLDGVTLWNFKCVNKSFTKKDREELTAAMNSGKVCTINVKDWSYKGHVIYLDSSNFFYISKRHEH